MIGQYAARVWKGYNRYLCARVGGDYRSPTSYHLGKIRDNSAFVRGLCWLISKGMNDDNHCVGTSQATHWVYFPLDSEGKYIAPLFIFAIAYDIFKLFAVGYFIWSMIT